MSDGAIGLKASLAIGVLALVLGGVAQGPPSGRFDIILRHGTILDGTGALPFAGDVAIRGASIARVGDLSGSTAAIDLDVSGLYVAPGFINIHSHATPSAL